MPAGRRKRRNPAGAPAVLRRAGDPLSPAASRPAAEAPGDVVPEPHEFAGWPRLGILSASLSVGPVGVTLERIDQDALDSLHRWACWPGRPELACQPAWRGLSVRLEFTRSEREGYLALLPGERARLLCWREGSARAMATHGAALLANEDATSGIVPLARVLPPDLDLALQNVLRVAVAWRLAASDRGLLLHAAAVETGDGCVLLMGPSGAGKTTALGFSWPRPALADDVVVLTAPSEEGGPWLAHPTVLWAHPEMDGRTARTSPLPVLGVLRLRQSPAPRVVALSRAAAMAAVIAHAPFLDGVGPPGATQLAERLCRDVRSATLELARDPGFWPVLEAWLGEESGA